MRKIKLFNNIKSIASIVIFVCAIICAHLGDAMAQSPAVSSTCSTSSENGGVVLLSAEITSDGMHGIIARSDGCATQGVLLDFKGEDALSSAYSLKSIVMSVGTPGTIDKKLRSVLEGKFIKSIGERSGRVFHVTKVRSVDISFVNR